MQFPAFMQAIINLIIPSGTTNGSHCTGGQFFASEKR